MILDKRYFERKFMKSKEVEDVLGGADSWKNVDKTESQWICLEKRKNRSRDRTACACLLTTVVVNCKEEKCDNRSAYFRQVQIRSADEPMTTFYKVF